MAGPAKLIRMRRFVSAVATLSTMAIAAPAHADSFDVTKLLDRGLAWIDRSGPSKNKHDFSREWWPSAGATAGTSPSSLDATPRSPAEHALERTNVTLAQEQPAPPERTLTTDDGVRKPSPGEATPRLHPSLIARDWKGAMAIAGGSTLPTDEIRLTRSSRMMLGRLSLGDGPIVPFAHFGVGEWRYDPELLPLMPHNEEYAAQASGGIEIRISPGAAFAWEADYTMLCRSRREPQNHPNPYLLGTFAVLETRF